MPLDPKTNPLPAGPNIQGKAVQLNPPTMKTPSVPATNFGGNSTGGNILSQTIGVLGNLFGDMFNRRHQKKMYQQQRQDALSDYEMQREDYLSDLASERAYNSPAAQKARLLEAGINPNIAFGNGNVANTSSNAENTASVRSSVFPSVPAASSLGSGIIATGLDMIRGRDMQSDIMLKQAQVVKALKESGLLDSQKHGTELDNISKSIANSFANMMYSTELDERRAHTRQLIDSLQTSAVQRIESIARTEKLIPAQVENLKAAAAEYYAKVANIEEQTSFAWKTQFYRTAQQADSFERSRVDTDMKFREREYQMLESSKKEFENQVYNILGFHAKDRSIVQDIMRDTFLLTNFVLKYKY